MMKVLGKDARIELSQQEFDNGWGNAAAIHEDGSADVLWHGEWYRAQTRFVCDDDDGYELVLHINRPEGPGTAEVPGPSCDAFRRLGDSNRVAHRVYQIGDV
jgi:hypothetical protein